MPFQMTWVPREPYLTHNGVVVYRAYHSDDASEPKTYHFSWDAESAEDDGTEFDVRDLPRPPEIAKLETDREIKVVLRYCIDLGILTNQGLNLSASTAGDMDRQEG